MEFRYQVSRISGKPHFSNYPFSTYKYINSKSRHDILVYSTRKQNKTNDDHGTERRGSSLSWLVDIRMRTKWLLWNLRRWFRSSNTGRRNIGIHHLDLWVSDCVSHFVLLQCWATHERNIWIWDWRTARAIVSSMWLLLYHDSLWSMVAASQGAQQRHDELQTLAGPAWWTTMLC